MKYAVGIDLGGTNIGAGIVREDGELIYKSSVPVIDSADVDGLLLQISDAAKLAVINAGMEPRDISFVGVGIPGVCRSKKGPVIFAPNIFWRNVDAANILERSIGLPVFLGNDADCAALGESHAGAGRRYNSMLMITLGTGVGGGMVIDGKLFEGGAFGGEFGHIPLVHNGLRCGCGKNGCFEAYASANALKRQARDAALEHPESVMWELCGGDVSKIGGRTPFDAADMGDVTGKAVVEQYISYLADGISGIVNLLRPEVVILGGGVSNQGDSLIDPLSEQVGKLCYAAESIDPPKVIRAVLGNDAGMIGAGMLGF